MEGLRDSKIFNENKQEGIWDKLEVKQCFQRESFIKYLRVTLVFIAKLSAFQGFTAGVNNAFFLARRLSTRLLFDEV